MKAFYTFFLASTFFAGAAIAADHAIVQDNVLNSATIHSLTAKAADIWDTHSWDVCSKTIDFNYKNIAKTKLRVNFSCKGKSDLDSNLLIGQTIVAPQFIQTRFDTTLNVKVTDATIINDVEQQHMIFKVIYDIKTSFKKVHQEAVVYMKADGQVDVFFAK